MMMMVMVRSSSAMDCAALHVLVLPAPALATLAALAALAARQLSVFSTAVLALLSPLPLFGCNFGRGFRLLWTFSPEVSFNITKVANDLCRAM